MGWQVFWIASTGETRVFIVEQGARAASIAKELSGRVRGVRLVNTRTQEVIYDASRSIGCNSSELKCSKLPPNAPA